MSALLHSPVGGSGAERWMACPASVRMSQGHTDYESDHAMLGTAAHTLAEHCLRTGEDSWESIGWSVRGEEIVLDPPDYDKWVLVDKDMADAVQVYLDEVRRGGRDEEWIEELFHCFAIHPLMYGRVDHAMRVGRRLTTTDYKHGAGIVVEVRENRQLMYYAAGLLEFLGLWNDVDEVVLRIVQPRAFHHMGPIREWGVGTAVLREWVDSVLRPAIQLAASTAESVLLEPGLLRAGDHCRFCPARFGKCPALAEIMEEVEVMAKKAGAAGGAAKLSNEDVGRYLTIFETAKIVQKAAREVGFERAQGGHSIPGWKLARARANREWKGEAEPEAVKRFGGEAMTEPALKSPAQVDSLPGGKVFTAEYAHKPEAGMQLVREDDARPEAGPKGRAMFAPVKRERERGKE